MGIGRRSGLLVAMCLLGVACGSPAGDPEPLLRLRASEIDQLVRAHTALGRFSGAVGVAVDGEVVFAAGYGLADRGQEIDNGPETRFDLASLTKQFTAAGILKLEAEGRLQVSDPVSAHLPRYPLPQGGQVTLHHLLSHRSGIPSLWRLGDGLEDIEPDTEPISLDALVALFAERDLLFPPGAEFRYSNSGFVLLAAIIEAVSGQSYADFLETELFEPLGMKDTGCRIEGGEATPYQGHAPAVVEVSREHPSWSLGDGCAFSTIVDLLNWAVALSDDRMLPAAQRAKLFARHSELRSGDGHGYGWFLSESHGHRLAHHGGASEGLVAEMALFPDDGLSIVVLSNYSPELGVNAAAMLVEQIAALHFGEPVAAPPAAVELSPGEIELLTGRYSMDSSGVFDVESEDGRLWIAAVDDTRSVFDFGTVGDPQIFERGTEFAMAVLRAGLGGEFERLKLCDPLWEELEPGELRDEWLQMLGRRGALVEMMPAASGRYPGEDMLIVVTQLIFERGEIFVSLDLTPALEICGWYPMDRAEFAIRDMLVDAGRVPLWPLAPGEFLVDGFNHREKGLRLKFRETSDGAMSLVLIGAFEHAGRRPARAPIREHPIREH